MEIVLNIIYNKIFLHSALIYSLVEYLMFFSSQPDILAVLGKPLCSPYCVVWRLLDFVNVEIVNFYVSLHGLYEHKKLKFVSNGQLPFWRVTIWIPMGTPMILKALIKNGFEVESKLIVGF